MSKKKTTDRDYLFLTAMLRARENSMLNGERAERLLDAASFAEAARSLTELGFEDMSQMDSAGVEKSLSARRSSMMHELDRMVPDKALLDIFRLKYDYHNAKVLVKAQAANVDGIRLLSDAGTIDPGRLMNAFNNAEWSSIPEPLSGAIQEAVSIISRTENPQTADFALDRAYFSQLYSLAEEAGDDFLIRYVRALIDSANLRSAVRTLRMGRDAKFLLTALIPGGSVGVNTIAEHFSESDGLNAIFSSSAVSRAASMAQDAVSGGALMAFERQCDDDITATVSAVRTQSFGAGCVAAYIYAFESELTNLRMILTGKLSGLSSAVIKERLRKSYV